MEVRKEYEKEEKGGEKGAGGYGIDRGSHLNFSRKEMTITTVRNRSLPSLVSPCTGGHAIYIA